MIDLSIFTHPGSVLALETFRLNGALIAAGDALTAPYGLTSARWQVMGAIAEANGGQPVAGLARNMGLVRQSVQRIVDELVEAGIVRLAPNPHHRRAKLAVLTERGEALLNDISHRWHEVAEALMSTVGAAELERAAAVLRACRDHLNAPAMTEDEL